MLDAAKVPLPCQQDSRGAKRLMAAAAPGTSAVGCTAGDGMGAAASGSVGAATGGRLLGFIAGNLGG